MADEGYIIIYSKINIIHLIIRFIKKQIDKFYKLQQNIIKNLKILAMKLLNYQKE